VTDGGGSFTVVMSYYPGRVILFATDEVGGPSILCAETLVSLSLFVLLVVTV
jgi:hypothetical protein